MSKHDQQLQGILRTEPSKEQYAEAAGRLCNHRGMRLLHAAMGVCTEAGEIMDGLKKYIFYGKALDRVNLFEEGGDVEWYLGILADELREIGGDHPFEEMIDRMLAKLRKRFPEKFTELDANVRDLPAERRILEKMSALKPECGHGAGDGFPGEDTPHSPAAKSFLPDSPVDLTSCMEIQSDCPNRECGGDMAFITPSGHVCSKCGVGY